jgi:hypothetical protein
MAATFLSQLANPPAFQSPGAVILARLARLSRFGFLGFMGFLGFLGFVPGWERLFGLSGLSGFFGFFGFAGFLGAAYYFECAHRRGADQASAEEEQQHG